MTAVSAAGEVLDLPAGLGSRDLHAPSVGSPADVSGAGKVLRRAEEVRALAVEVLALPAATSAGGQRDEGTAS